MNIIKRTNQDSFLLSLIIPVFNENQCIDPFVERVKTALDDKSINYHMIFVNDGSEDGTEKRLLELSIADEKIKFINLSRNFGKDVALTAGIDFAQGDAVIPIDVDLQHPPEVIPKMISLWLDGYDVVNARRSDQDSETIFKKLFSKIFYSTFNFFSTTPIPSGIGDFRLIDHKVVIELRKLRETHRFMKGLFAWVGYNQIAINYDRSDRIHGITKWRFRSLFNFAVNGITSFSISALRLSMIVGFTISILGFIYALLTVYKTMIYGIDVPGYASLIILILILGGVQLISIGIQGEYIGKIFEEVKKRPIYIIKEKNL